MHEMSLATGLMDQMLEVAAQNHLKKIEEVELDVGLLCQVIDEVMQETFVAVTEGTIAEGAKLIMNEVRPEAQCRLCSHIFEPEINNFLCPKCEKANVDILKGQDLILKSIVSHKCE